MSKKFALNRSQRAKLAYEIKRFNATMERLGVSSPVTFEYKRVAPYFGNKREYTQFVHRLQRLQKPSQQKILTNKQGVQYLKWEQVELQRMNKKANLQRKKSQERFIQEESLGFKSAQEREYYEPRKYGFDRLQGRKFIRDWFWFEFREGQSNTLNVRDERYKSNVIASLRKWPQVKEIKDLINFINNQDSRMIALISLDERYGVSIGENYEHLISMSYSDNDNIKDNAGALLNRWQNAVWAYEKYGKVGI